VDAVSRVLSMVVMADSSREDLLGRLHSINSLILRRPRTARRNEGGTALRFARLVGSLTQSQQGTPRNTHGGPNSFAMGFAALVTLLTGDARASPEVEDLPMRPMMMPLPLPPRPAPAPSPILVDDRSIDMANVAETSIGLSLFPGSSAMLA